MTVSLYKAIDSIVDAYNVELPELYKRRDPREPGRAEKEQFEDKLARLTRKRFKTQKKAIANTLRWTLPQKQIDDWMSRVGDPDDPETEALMFALIVAGMAHGLQLFTQSVGVLIDVEQFNLIASEVARNYMTKWLEGLDKTTLKGLRQQLVNYAEIPGYSIEDVMAGLPFSSERAQRIAITETTRIYGMATQIAGDLLVEENPGIRVIMTWFTEADGRVCIICQPLDGVSVIFGDGFRDINGDVHFHEPAHVNCRCWTVVSTDVDEEVELG